MKFDVPLSALAWAAIVFVLSAAALELVRRVFVARARRRDGPTPTEFTDLAMRLLDRTGLLFVAAVALAITAQFYTLPISRRALRTAVIIVVLIQLARWGSTAIEFAIVRYAARRPRPEDAGAITTMHALGIVARIALWVVLALLALANFGVNVTALIAGLGIGGIAIALAMQNILGDLFGALSIALDKPFVVGDLIEIDAYIGHVEHIGLKTTRLRSLTGEQIIISNSELLKSRIRNYRDVGNTKRPRESPAGA